MEWRSDAASTPIDWDSVDAFLFDLDGVLTPTALIHEHAWKRAFDAFLAWNADGAPWEPFSAADYLTFVDGKRRVDGVRSFIESRGIHLPDGTPEDEPGYGTVNAVGNTKNAAFQEVLRSEGVEPYPGSVRLLDTLERHDGGAVAVVSSSRNANEVLAAAGLASRFTVVVDGNVATSLKLPGKPAPDTFLHAAEQLGVPAARAAVVEDAISGVAAGRAGRFGAVIGVDRGAGHRALLANGADVVVDDLDELVPTVIANRSGQR
jgi:beta-phosphoglucomutase family hydrolase